MTVAEVAQLVGGRVEGLSECVLTGAEVDSRLLQEGELFVALPGAQHDGHEFVPQALTLGGAALVREGVELAPPSEDRALIVVEDPLSALWKLARVERQRRAWEIVAITGSVGKTTVKDFLARLMLRHRRTGWSQGNRNNTLGLPGQLLRQPENVELFVAEAGMSSAGELDTLGGILEPIRLLLYTRIAPVHTEFFPEIDGIVRSRIEDCWEPASSSYSPTVVRQSSSGCPDATRWRTCWRPPPRPRSSGSASKMSLSVPGISRRLPTVAASTGSKATSRWSTTATTPRQWRSRGCSNC
jgi:UDP-N-acetylmuramyl pentapeptide synthase